MVDAMSSKLPTSIFPRSSSMVLCGCGKSMHPFAREKQLYLACGSTGDSESFFTGDCATELRLLAGFCFVGVVLFFFSPLSGLLHI